MPKRRSITRADEGGCHRCTSHRHCTGRPIGYRDGKSTTVARMVYLETHGEIGPGLVVRQTCGNTWCIKPEHLTATPPPPAPGRTSPPKPVEYQVNENGCHICTSHYYSNGYPGAKRNGRTRNLSRILWEETYGPIPAGLVVRHKCDRPACINVEHLELGTHADNVRDRVERGRSATGERNGRARRAREAAARSEEAGNV